MMIPETYPAAANEAAVLSLFSHELREHRVKRAGT